MPAPAPPPLPGDRVGRYLLGAVLGVGGMATVYRATSPSGRPLAVKVLHPGMGGTEEGRRFRREYLTLRGLRHPGVVRVFDAGEHGEYPWIAMELIEGTDLGSVIERWQLQRPPDRFARVERILRGLCEALAYIHSQGLIHRDLKPGNVLVTQDGDARLTDFGVVKAPGGQFTTQLTMVGRLVGTAAFMAPEQITGAPVDGRADLYSLGAVLYMMLTGERPIVADSIAGYLSRHLTEDPSPPSELDPRVPPRLERIALRLLRKDPAQRFPSARQVIAALDADEGGPERPVHGRDAELERLLGRLTELRGGRGGVLLLTGPFGVGRSTLLRCLSERAREAGHGLSLGAGASPELLDALCEQVPALGQAAEAGPPERRIAVRTAGRPWALLVDDLDDADDRTLRALTALVRQQVGVEGEPLLLIGVARGLVGALAGLGTGASTGVTPERIELGGLDRRAFSQIVLDLGLAGAAAAALAGRLHPILSGAPGGLIEQIDALVGAGWLAPAPGGGLRAARDLDDLRERPLPLPARLQGEEAARVDAIEPRDRAVLDALAVLDAPAEADVLVELVGLDAAEVDGCLERLRAAGLARSEQVGVLELHQLDPARPQDLLYSRMEASTRAHLHRAAAAALQRRSRRQLALVAPVIAGHLLRGGQVTEAYPLLVQAARRALRGDQLEPAARLMRLASEARAAAEPALTRVEARRQRRALGVLEAELAEAEGDAARAARSWRETLDLAHEDGDAATEQRARAGLALAWAAAGETEAAAPVLEAALAELGRGDPVWPQLARTLAEVRLGRGDLTGARGLWAALRELGRDTSVPGLTLDARLGEALAALAGGDLAMARRRFADAELALRELPRGGVSVQSMLVKTLIHLATLDLWDGRLSSALDFALEAERAARAPQRPEARVWALGLAALTHDARGDRAGCRDRAREAAALSRERGGLPGPGGLLAVATTARALCAAGEPQEALELLPELPFGQPAGLHDPVGQALAARARARARSHPDRAHEDAWTALGREPPLLPTASARIAIDAAVALWEAGDPAAGDAVFEALDRTTGPGLRMLRLAALRAGAAVGVVDPAELRAVRAPLVTENRDFDGFLARWS